MDPFDFNGNLPSNSYSIEQLPKLKKSNGGRTPVCNVSIKETAIKRRTINNIKFCNVRFSQIYIYQCTFNNCEFENCWFVGTRIRDCEFHKCNFIHTNTHKIKISETYIDPRSFKNAIPQKKYSNIGVHLHQMLMNNASETTQPDFFKHAEFSFRIWKMRQTKYEYKINDLNLTAYYFCCIKYLIYRYLLGFGIKFRYLFGFTSISIGLFFWINYNCWESMGIVQSFDTSPPAKSFVGVLYFTLISITTLGYGDFYPTTTYGRLVVCAELLVGLVILGAFVNLVSKRVVR